MSSPVGSTLADRYRLEARIGAGGMSTVYRAFDTVLERTVAIKRMHRDIADKPEQLERFRREARAVAQLNHPYIVQVIDAGEENDTPFIVFEHVDGETLKQRIQRLGRLPVTEAVAYAIEIARALGAAHERGIVHRDVKPQNVLINDEGEAKVTDFGIARTLEEDGLTADGRVIGTTDYVSPEQAMGRPVGGQSDVYSLGIVLFEMLVGDVPFRGENQVAIAMKHVREELPDVQILRPSVASALAAVVDRATAKDTDVRYLDTGELIADLEDVLTIEASRRGQATGEATNVLRALPEEQRSRAVLRARRPVLLGLGILLLIGALSAAGYVLLGDRASRGTGEPTGERAGERAVSLGQRRARDYDPMGDDEEHRDETPAVLDRDPNTSWSTETYQGDIASSKAADAGTATPGVGIYVDARPSVDASRLQVLSSTPGWTGEVYAAPDGSGPPGELADPQWRKVGDVRSARRRTSVTIDAPGRERYFLVWITELPPEEQQVRLNEIELFRRTSG